MSGFRPTRGVSPTSEHARSAQAGASVTVVIPCYNYARFLPHAVGSALTQDGVEVDVIIVDDASTDSSVEIARGFAENDQRVQVLVNERNRGAVGTFNRGLAAAEGEFLVRLDADDLLTPGSLERAIAVMQSLPSVGLVYGHPLHFSGAELPIPRHGATRWLVWAGPDWLGLRCAAGTNVITSPEVVMRRSVVDVVGGQRDLAHTHDMEMWLRIAAHSDVAYVAGADQAWHREHGGSLSTKAEDPRIILGEIADAFDVLFDGWTSPDLDPTPLRALSRRGVAAQAVASARTDLDRGIVTDAAIDLLALADQIDPGIAATRSGRAAAAARRRAVRLPRRLAALLGIPPRLRRKLRFTAEKRRWARTGVYEKVSFHPGRTPVSDDAAKKGRR